MLPSNKGNNKLSQKINELSSQKKTDRMCQSVLQTARRQLKWKIIQPMVPTDVLRKASMWRETVCVITRRGSKVPGNQEAEAERNTQLKSVWAALLWLLLFSQTGDLAQLKNAGLEQEPLDDILNITEARWVSSKGAGLKWHPEPRMSNASMRQAWNTADAGFKNQTNRKISQSWQNGSMHKNT